MYCLLFQAKGKEVDVIFACMKYILLNDLQGHFEFFKTCININNISTYDLLHLGIKEVTKQNHPLMDCIIADKLKGLVISRDHLGNRFSNSFVRAI